MIPEQYQELLYIQSSGTQYIDTKYIGGENPSYEIVADFEGSNNWGQYFAGPKNPGKNLCPPKIFQYASSHSCCFEGYNQSGGMIRVPLAGEKTYSIIVNNSLIKFDTQVLEECTKKMFTWGTVSYWIFNSHEEPNLFSHMKLYGLRMWSDKLLVRDFIPCYIKATDEIGLYEKVENKFYKNDGTGIFIKGPEVYYPDNQSLGTCPSLFSRILRKKKNIKNIKPLKRPMVHYIIEEEQKENK